MVCGAMLVVFFFYCWTFARLFSLAPVAVLRRRGCYLERVASLSVENEQSGTACLAVGPVAELLAAAGGR